MPRSILSVLKVVAIGVLLTGLIAACGGPVGGASRNGSNGSAVQPAAGSPAQSQAAPANAQPPAASNSNHDSAVQPTASGNAVAPAEDTSGAAADQALTGLEDSLNAVDTIDDLK